MNDGTLLREGAGILWGARRSPPISGPNKLQDIAVADGCARDHSGLVHRDALRKAGVVLRSRIGDEGRDDTIRDAADANAAMVPRVVAVLTGRVARL